MKSPFCFVALGLLLACGDDKNNDTSLDTATSTPSTPSTTSPTSASSTSQTTTETATVQDIWNSKCTPCHIGGSVGGGLALDDGHTSMVGVPSTQVPSMSLVEPGSREDSYLWHKLQGTYMPLGGIGDPMPITGELSPAQVEQIGVWIDDGAPVE